MKLRFQVDQAACLRAGIDCPKSIVEVEVDPKKLTQKQLKLLDDHMHGMNVCYRDYDDAGKFYVKTTFQRKPNLVKADRPTLDALLKALAEHERDLMEESKL